MAFRERIRRMERRLGLDRTPRCEVCGGRVVIEECAVVSLQSRDRLSGLSMRCAYPKVLIIQRAVSPGPSPSKA